MFTVSKERLLQATSFQVGVRPQMVSEASALEFPVGHWPVSIFVLDNKNNSLMFMQGARLPDGGYAYASRDGSVQWHILND